MPATHLMSVDLPAPLSPTRAMTSPSRTSKSTSWSACTDPKLLETKRSSSVGEAVSFTGVFYHGGLSPFPQRAETGTVPTSVLLLLAELRVLAVTDLAALQEAFLEEQLVVRLRHPDRRQQDRLRAADLAVHAGDLLALDDRHCGSCRGLRLLADRLVDGPALPAGEDELHVGRRRVLAGERDRLQAVGLERRDHGAGETVVRGQRPVDLVAVPSQDLVEDLPTLDWIPVRPLVAAGRLLERALAVQRAQDRVVALLEELRVVVLDVAVQLGDHRMAPVLALRPERGDETLALELPDLHVVEGDVVGRLAADDEPVVVDDLRAAADREVGDRGARSRVELVEQDDLRALRQALLGLRLLLLRVGVRVQDGRGDAGRLERLAQVRRVEERVARRRLRVGQQRARLDRGVRPRRPRGCRRRGDRGRHEHGREHEPGRRAAADQFRHGTSCRGMAGDGPRNARRTE